MAGDAALHIHNPEENDDTTELPPTLAQLHGLVPPPPSRLTQAEWETAELNHQVRDAQRGMDETSCAICMERLSAGEQVILSCSHVYHSVCLINFERFTKRKMDRSCPLCRCANYQKKNYSPAQALLRKRSAIRVQTVFRRYLTKQGYQTVLQQHYSSGKGDRARAHAFFADRVHKVSDRLVEAMNEKTSEVDALVNESDRALELSRSIFASLDQDARMQSTSQQGGSVADGEGKMYVTWPNVRRAAEKRGLCDCPICMTSLNRNENGGGGGGEGGDESLQSPVSVGRTQVSLLSCTHVFHERCIEAFEKFTKNATTNFASVVYTCPVCRAGYNRKRLLDVNLLLEQVPAVKEDVHTF